MKIEYDDAKRQRTLAERGLDFEDAAAVFDGDYFSRVDDRRDYGEERLISIGMVAPADRRDGMDPKGGCRPRDFDENGT